MDYLNNLIESLSAKLGSLIPGVIGALLILIVGYFLAKIVKKVTKKLLSKTSIDEKLGNKLDAKFRIDDFVAKLLYYLVLLYTLLIVLNVLGVQGVLAPIQTMLDSFLGYLPNVIAGGIIGYAGYMIAKIASEATGFITQKVETFSAKNKLDTGGLSLTKIIKQLVFIFIFIPILIIALDTLKMDAVSQPATEMLRSFMNAIPKIIAAAILLAVIYIAGKYIVGIFVELLKNLGLDKFSNEIGIDQVIGKRTLSKTLGNIALFFIMFTGIIAAIEKLELFQIGSILTEVLAISGKIFFGIVILFVGVFISNLATKATKQNGGNKWLTHIVRFATMGLFLAFSLHTMGIADNIVELAFGLTLGAIAIAFALAFGLGGREAAGKQMEFFFNKFKKED